MTRRSLLLLLLLGLDFLWLPYPTQKLPRPAWLVAVAKAPPGLLLNIPGGHRSRGAEDMYLQTLHGRPIAGGYTSVIPAAMEQRVEELPFLKLIFEGRPQVELKPDLQSELKRALLTLDVRIVVLHLDRERERLEKEFAARRGTLEARLYNPEKGLAAASLATIRGALRRLWGEPLYHDAEAEVFVRP